MSEPVPTAGNTSQGLWKVEARFPAWCGNDAYTSESHYGAETIEEAVAFHKAKYSHSVIIGCRRLGCVFLRGEVTI